MTEDFKKPALTQSSGSLSVSSTEEFKNKPALKRSSGSVGRKKKHFSAPSPPSPISVGCFSSAHLIVNMERRRNQRNAAGDKQQQPQLQPLLRSGRLDDLAQQHATLLAQQGTLLHMAQSMQDLKEILQANNVGENVQRGESIRAMHQTAMQAIGKKDKDPTPAHDDDNNNSNVNDDDAAHQQTSRLLADNILSPTFTEFGIGTAMCSTDGKLYMVQLFRGGYWV